MASTLLDSLVAEIARLDGDALVMHVGEKPYVVAKSAGGDLDWDRVEVSDRPLTPDALLGMLGQMISFDERRALYDGGSIEIEAGGDEADRRFLIAASRDADDVRLEIRRRDGIRVPVDAWSAFAHPTAPLKNPVPPAPTHEPDSEHDFGGDFELELEMLSEPDSEDQLNYEPATVSVEAASAEIPGSETPAAGAAFDDSIVGDVQDESPSAVILPHVRSSRVPAQPPAPAVRSDSAIVELLRLPALRHASRVHVSPGQLPMGCIDGRMVTFVTAPVVSVADIDRFALEFRTAPSTLAEWTCAVPDVGSLTCVDFDDERGRGIVLHLPEALRSAAELDLEPAICALAEEADGLIVIAGRRASGKSTLVHALADLINVARSDYLITIESSVRVRHGKHHAIVSQRQRDGGGEAVAAAARAALREGPDVLVIDDLRSPEALEVALDGARGGRLVIAVLPAPSVTAAMSRLIDGFVTSRRPQLQALLASSLRAVVAQTFVECIGGGRVAAREVLLNGSAVAPLVCDGATWHLTAAMEAGRKLGMKTMADALSSLVRRGIVDARSALASAPDREALLAALAREGAELSDLERRA